MKLLLMLSKKLRGLKMNWN